MTAKFSLRRVWQIAVATAAFVYGHSLSAAETSWYTAATYQSAELCFVDGIPVITVSGTPEEIGAQLGTLAKEPLRRAMEKKDEFVRTLGLSQPLPLLLKTAVLVRPTFPERYRHELEALSKAADVDLDLLTFGNIAYDLSRIPACSTLAVEPERSTTGGPLFGRNLDFQSFGILDKFGVLVIYKPEKQHAFASIAFPGAIGVFTGMNDAGLCVAQLEVGAAADGVPHLNLAGTPSAMCFRRILEECTTVDEAEKVMRDCKRMIICNLAVCDRQHAAVLEITPTSVIRRVAEHGICPCTNHFRTKQLAVGELLCPRYAKLAESEQIEKLDVATVARLLDAVNQGENTIQSMVFEPATLRLHLSLGPAPASSQPLRSIELTDYFPPR
jgi:isopenicillin-N N-acyltransferase like protein